ncbi:unnamed protein product, partial [Arabidopsis halleri]
STLIFFFFFFSGLIWINPSSSFSRALLSHNHPQTISDYRSFFFVGESFVECR